MIKLLFRRVDRPLRLLFDFPGYVKVTNSWFIVLLLGLGGTDQVSPVISLLIDIVVPVVSES